MTSHQRRQSRRQCTTVPQLDTPTVDDRFYVSSGNVQRWVASLSSPKAQAVDTPAMRNFENTAQGSPPPAHSHSNSNQISRYELRSRQLKRAQPATPARQAQSTSRLPKNNNKKEPKQGQQQPRQQQKAKQKRGRKPGRKLGRKPKTKATNSQKNTNSDNDDVNAPDTESILKPSWNLDHNTGEILMARPPKRRATLPPIPESPAGSEGPSRPPQRLDPFMWPVSSNATSNRDKASERISVTQKLINLATLGPPFIYKSSVPNNCPTPVKDLCQRLQAAGILQHDHILPIWLKSEITDDFPDEFLPHSLWIHETNDPPELKKVMKEHYQLVKGLYEAMVKCNRIGGGHSVEEVNWYSPIEKALSFFQSQVPRPVADEDMSDEDREFSNLQVATCSINDIVSDCLPRNPITLQHTQSARVDLLIGYNWDQSPLKEYREARQVLPLPITPLKYIERTFLGAIPIEVKNGAGNPMDARYQLALCASAMLHLRQLWAGSQNKQFNPDKPPIVISLSVIGHFWCYYIMYLGPRKTAGGQQGVMNAQTTQDYHGVYSTPRIFLGPFVAGNTVTLHSTLYLFQFFQVLRSWLVEEWGPEVFEELIGIPIAEPPLSVRDASSGSAARPGSAHHT